MVAALLASTPLLPESWRLCNAVNTASPPRCSLAVEQAGGICYVVFSTLQTVPSTRGPDLVPLETVGGGFFSPLCRRNDERDEQVMVDAGMLKIFFDMYSDIQSQIGAAMERSKLIVITGQSVGGPLASLSTLWLLCYLQSIPPLGSQVLCITFGSPLLGNKPLSNAILRERWACNFCHIVSKHDIMPRILIPHLPPHIYPYVHMLLQYCAFSITSPQLPISFPDQYKAAIFGFIVDLMEDGTRLSGYWPFGSYMFCSEKGAVCVDNAESVVKMMLLLLKTGSPSSSVEDHLKYSHYIGSVSLQLFKARSFTARNPPESSFDAGVALALESAGISNQEAVAGEAKECVEKARRIGIAPNLKSAELAVGLSRVLPCRLEIQWYKERCDASDEQLGYYDFFKRGSLRRDNRININRHKLGIFWDEVIKMMEKDQLPHDFQGRLKWVNASQFYKLLVEPLDIAEFYKNKKPNEKGKHYMTHGRARRYLIFDRWWRDRPVSGRENFARTRFASATQDSCFWAKVEEAREWLDDMRTERDWSRRTVLFGKIVQFQKYAEELVERKEVSVDVLAKNSSYSQWVADLKEFKSQQNLPTPPRSETLRL